jgi:hypothetical protein
VSASRAVEVDLATGKLWGESMMVAIRRSSDDRNRGQGSYDFWSWLNEMGNTFASLTSMDTRSSIVHVHSDAGLKLVSDS